MKKTSSALGFFIPSYNAYISLSNGLWVMSGGGLVASGKSLRFQSGGALSGGSTHITSTLGLAIPNTYPLRLYGDTTNVELQGRYETVYGLMVKTGGVDRVFIHQNGITLMDDASAGIMPESDNTKKCGGPSNRWTDVYAVNLHGTLSDLELTDVECYACGRRFAVGDRIVFVVKRGPERQADGQFKIATVPVCERCRRTAHA